MEKSSLLYWYPRILEFTSIRIPKTHIIQLTEEEKSNYWQADACGTDRIEAEIKRLLDVGEFSLPIFVKTDEFSNKWFWEKSCFIDDISKLKKNLFEIICGSRCADIMGLPIEAIVIRQYIPMNELFKTYIGNMPVNPEIRVFAKDGEALCWHWYWIEESIEKDLDYSHLTPSNWKDILNSEKKKLSGSTIKKLNGYARRITAKLGGYWSIDFCQAKDGRWILIDMAEGEKSWHPEDCKNYVKQHP